jgi:hypothetical protein
MSTDDQPIIPPPASVTVEMERKPILWLPDGTPLVRRPVGFDTRPPCKNQERTTR